MKKVTFDEDAKFQKSKHLRWKFFEQLFARKTFTLNDLAWLTTGAKTLIADRKIADHNKWVNIVQYNKHLGGNWRILE